jgi:hypothetical protein
MYVCALVRICVIINAENNDIWEGMKYNILYIPTDSVFWLT